MSGAELILLLSVIALGCACAYITGFMVGHVACLHSTERKLREGEVVRFPGGTLATKNGWTAP